MANYFGTLSTSYNVRPVKFKNKLKSGQRWISLEYSHSDGKIPIHTVSISISMSNFCFIYRGEESCKFWKKVKSVAGEFTWSLHIRKIVKNC